MASSFDLEALITLLSFGRSMSIAVDSGSAPFPYTSCFVECRFRVGIPLGPAKPQHLAICLMILEVLISLICVIVEDGKVLSSGSNRTTETRNASRHAELEAIDVLLQQWQSMGFSPLEVAEKFSKCDLYVTCEPCIMCASALSILPKVVSLTVVKVVDKRGSCALEG
ncbi:hypothetical protein H6P81_006563 [Aristolochia fimbriata]|uniref:CMP/dCMP-type deaminase domain-containing protein n=1 Tax=Aristolochia fimbriata TaxID=158543 RepID=A0AAV7EYK9_ARIFI|nr:hypothetical protein H6P81_006563 [Aristolochia fimbriata]